MPARAAGYSGRRLNRLKRKIFRWAIGIIQGFFFFVLALGFGGPEARGEALFLYSGNSERPGLRGADGKARPAAYAVGFVKYGPREKAVP